MRTAYVMGAREDRELVRDVIEVLRSKSYVVEHDWTTHVDQATIKEENLRSGGYSDHGFRQEIAIGCLVAATTSSLGVVACGTHFPSIGARLAVAGWTHVIAPPRDSVFFDYPGVVVFDSFATWARELEAA